ncbi:metalloprotease PmbA [Gammaproteobacteria bacterium 45_16_T64]|nr:metalloprotease PmbA [Gammaproteobacteria bacterium 45_16_T64]
MNVEEEQKQLQDCIDRALTEASLLGATQAEVAASSGEGLSVSVRSAEVETVEFTKNRGFAITVYTGHSKGSSSTSDLSLEAIRRAVAAAIDIAHYTADDECSGLAAPELLASDALDLDLYHPWDLDSTDAVRLALDCEQAGLSNHPNIKKSDGASVSSSGGVRVYGNSHGFFGAATGTSHSIGCSMIAENDSGMERSHWFSGGRVASALDEAAFIGDKAASRAVKRLGARKIVTCDVPVLYSAEVAGSLVGHLIGAISGGNLFRKSSFMLDSLGTAVMPPIVSIYELPQLLQGNASASFDGDGLATYEKKIVNQGTLESYIMGVYSARRLGMQSTANAGGVRNLRAASTGQSLEQLFSEMGTGLYVTSLMGQGVNMVTGDYSRGAEGFWIENGELQYPVKEVTIAGNLADMFLDISAIGTDTDTRGNVQVGSMLISKMKVAGA